MYSHQTGSASFELETQPFVHCGVVRSLFQNELIVREQQHRNHNIRFEPDDSYSYKAPSYSETRKRSFRFVDIVVENHST